MRACVRACGRECAILIIVRACMMRGPNLSSHCHLYALFFKWHACVRSCVYVFSYNACMRACICACTSFCMRGVVHNHLGHGHILTIVFARLTAFDQAFLWVTALFT